MISAKMEEALNNQINAELYSSYLYYAMSMHFESVGLKGFAVWMKFQAQEEMMHAVKFADYLNDRDGRVKLAGIETPPSQWDNPLACFEVVLEHEQKVTKLINDLSTLAMQENDHAARTFLEWFVDEQVEEEANARQIIDDLKLVGSDKSGLFMINRELGQRQPPVMPDTKA
ncbi:MAG: ferritin [bacterium]|jgi:ferritin|nr:ferritin [bacterium]